MNNDSIIYETEPLNIQFNVRGAETIKDGKPTWPHDLTVNMGRIDAFQFLRMLATQLEHGNTMLSFSFVGVARKIQK